jgi:hypothetical protein
VTEGQLLSGTVQHSWGCSSEEYYAAIWAKDRDNNLTASLDDIQYSNVFRYTQNGQGTFPLSIVDDALEEGAETFRVRIFRRGASIFSTPLAESNVCTILPSDRQLWSVTGPMSPNGPGGSWISQECIPATSVNNFAGSFFLVQTEPPLPNGTPYTWQVRHVETDENDFTPPGVTSGASAIGQEDVFDIDGSDVFYLPVRRDNGTRPREYFCVDVYHDGKLVATKCTSICGQAAPPPSKLYSCCLPDGTCLPDRTVAQCVALGGQVTSTPCEQNPCPQPTCVPLPGSTPCGSASAAGGAQFTQQYYSVWEGGGTIRVHYDVGTLADRFRFFHANLDTLLYDTGFITGSGSFVFTKPSGICTIRVESQGQDATTRWCYTLMCVNDNSTPPACNPFA